MRRLVASSSGWVCRDLATSIKDSKKAARGVLLTESEYSSMPGFKNLPPQFE
jgi:hypothetical protein